MRKWIGLIVLVIAAALVFWFFYPIRSMIVMSIYSGQHESESVMKENGLDIEMPSGPGWYPFVMTYNAHGFDNWSGVDADMSIMYNFGAFDHSKRTSAIYDPQSDFYSSFYGAYVVQSDGAFGFDDSGQIDMNEVSLAVEYDYTQLVIKDFGSTEQTFKLLGYISESDVWFAGSGGWTRVDAVMFANGAAHNYIEYKQPYLQYGRPMETVDVDFGEMKLFGRVYAKYFSEYDCSVMIYVIAPSEDAVDTCDNDILKATVIIETD